jgi:hypothetical protein
MVQILGREITLRKKNDGQEATRYNYTATEVEPTLEKRGALRMVFSQAAIRDSADFELDSTEVRIQNRYDEMKQYKILDEKGNIKSEELAKLSAEAKAKIKDLQEQIEILFMYRSLLFRCTHIGARFDPVWQKKLAALYRLIERKITRLPSYRPRLRVLINYLWSVSFRLKEGEVPPPILIETPQVFPIKQGGGQGLNRLTKPGEDEDSEEN